MRKFLHNNGLSVFFLALFILSMTGQFFTGFAQHNKERKEDGQPALSLPAYFRSGHFIQATFENWESEFLQMALFVVATISLRQKGSSESKSLDKPEAVDRAQSKPVDASQTTAPAKNSCLLGIFFPETRMAIPALTGYPAFAAI